MTAGKITIAYGDAPGTPSSGFSSLYLKSDKKLYLRDDAGNEVSLQPDLTNVIFNPPPGMLADNVSSALSEIFLTVKGLNQFRGDIPHDNTQTDLEAIAAHVFDPLTINIGDWVNAINTQTQSAKLYYYDSTSNWTEITTETIVAGGINSGDAFKGTWNPTTNNSPALSDGTGTEGFIYKASQTQADFNFNPTGSPRLVDVYESDLFIYRNGQWSLWVYGRAFFDTLYQSSLGFTAENTANKNTANGYCGLNESGLVPVNRIPPAALERIKIVTDSAARFALTTSDVQDGDTVKETSTGQMFFVTDDTNLGNSNGYEVYTATAASSVDWTGVTNIPIPVSSLTGTNTGDQDLSGLTLKVNSSTDNAIVRFDGTTGTQQNSGVIIDDNNGLSGFTPVIVQKTANYTLLATDSGKYIDFNSASDLICTLPVSTTAHFGCIVRRRGTGNVTFAANGNTIEIEAGHTKLAVQYAAANIAFVATGVCAINGRTA